MTATSTSSSANSGFHYGNPMTDCKGAQLRRQCRQLATLLTVTGTIDETNVDLVLRHAKGCVIPEKPVIVDLSGVTSFTAQAIALLDDVAEGCAATGEEWLLIASPQVIRTLRLCGVEDDFPTESSVPDALHHFSDVVCERRRLLPVLTKSA
jgi:anti-anti-sigma regulatory factor